MLASPEDDRREARDSDFQARVLAVLERPKRKRVLLVINSPFFLWIMTAIFLTVGGSYYATYHMSSGRREYQHSIFCALKRIVGAQGFHKRSYLVR